MTTAEITPQRTFRRTPPEWQPAADACPRGDVAATARFCVRYAVLAPSTHNDQPWLFRVTDTGADCVWIDVLLDTARGLPVTDEQDREGIISIGAAVFNLRVALAHFELSSRLQLWPDPVDPECCARLHVTEGAGDDTAAALFDAIPRRHTSRAAFRRDTIARAVLDELCAAAAAEGARLHIVTDYVDRHAVAELVGAADKCQMADPHFRRELARWLRVAGSRSRDGIRGYSVAPPDALALAAPLLVRTFDVGTGRAAQDHELAAFSPALALLTASGDTRTDWLVAGQALERVLLQATMRGLSAGFLDQPIEVSELREAVAATFGTGRRPQILLRLGYAVPGRGGAAVVQRRRPVEQVLVP